MKAEGKPMRPQSACSDAPGVLLASGKAACVQNDQALMADR